MTLSLKEINILDIYDNESLKVKYSHICREHELWQINLLVAIPRDVYTVR